MRQKRNRTFSVPEFWVSPWLLIGVVLVLGIAASIVVFRSTGREEQYMYTRLQERAEVLMFAMEGGIRSMGMRWRGQPDYAGLLAELARQPDILYVALVDTTGTAVAHSDTSLAGSRLPVDIDFNTLRPGEKMQWRVSEHNDSYIFEAYKLFTPLRMPGHRGMHGGRHMMNPPPDENLPDLTIFVGIDATPVAKSLQDNFQTTLLLAVLVAVCGIGGILLLLVAQNYLMAKRMLRSTQALADQVVTSLPLGLLTLDRNGKVTLCNSACSSMLRLPAAAAEGQMLHLPPHLDWQGIIQQLDAGTRVREQETSLFFPAGETLPVSVTAAKIDDSHDGGPVYLFLLDNLEELHALKEQIHLQERLAALGNLAAGVAHEIRNPLSSIRGFAVLLHKRVQEDAAAVEAAQAIMQETQRLDGVVSELLELARPQELEYSPVNPVEMLSRALRLAGADAQAKGVGLDFDAATKLRCEQGNLPEISLDEQKLTQALLNLLLNAVQATDPGGTITVSANIERNGDCGTPGQCLAVRIADTGTGMDAVTLRRIFTPYFTTKDTGTGLGLTIAHQIIAKHGGTLVLHSQPGKGTVAAVCLPLTPSAASD